MSTIVVGVDGSEGARRALEWAAGEASLRRAGLRAVLAWDYPPALVAGAGWALPDAETLELHGSQMGQLLDEQLAAVAAALEGIDVERRVVHGPPAGRLLEAAADADLLVVGTRGHGGFVGLLLGSVSQQVVHHAPCPVVVVPPPEH